MAGAGISTDTRPGGSALSASQTSVVTGRKYGRKRLSCEWGYFIRGSISWFMVFSAPPPCSSNKTEKLMLMLMLMLLMLMSMPLLLLLFILIQFTLILFVLGQLIN